MVGAEDESGLHLQVGELFKYFFQVKTNRPKRGNNVFCLGVVPFSSRGQRKILTGVDYGPITHAEHGRLNLKLQSGVSNQSIKNLPKLENKPGDIHQRILN